MDPVEICASDLTQQVMVIQLPRGDRAESDLSAYRDYVVESLAQGVLVLGSGTTWAVENRPKPGRGSDPAGCWSPPGPQRPGAQGRSKAGPAEPVEGKEGDPGAAPAVPSGGRPGLSGGGGQPVRRRSHGGQAPGCPHRSGKTAH